MKNGCKELSGLTACELPKLDIKEHRKALKAYMKQFVKDFNEAIKDDELCKKMSYQDVVVGERYVNKIHWESVFVLAQWEESTGSKVYKQMNK